MKTPEQIENERLAPAPTTAAPAELPNRREFHVSTPAEFAAAAQVAQGGDAIIVPAEWPRESPAERPFRLPEPVLSREEGEAALRDLAVMRGDAPAEQLSGKVVCVVDKEPHDYLRPMLGFGGCRDTAPAEQPGKATDPRPAQPQAPAEPTKEQIEKAGRVLAAVMVAERRGENMDPIIARALAAEAAPLREERDRLACELEAMRRERNGAQSQRDQERARAEQAEARLSAAPSEAPRHCRICEEPMSDTCEECQ